MATNSQIKYTLSKQQLIDAYCYLQDNCSPGIYEGFAKAHEDWKKLILNTPSLLKNCSEEEKEAIREIDVSDFALQPSVVKGTMFESSTVTQDELEAAFKEEDDKREKVIKESAAEGRTIDFDGHDISEKCMSSMLEILLKDGYISHEAKFLQQFPDFNTEWSPYLHHILTTPSLFNRCSKEDINAIWTIYNDDRYTDILKRLLIKGAKPTEENLNLEPLATIYKHFQKFKQEKLTDITRNLVRSLLKGDTDSLKNTCLRTIGLFNKQEKLKIPDNYPAQLLTYNKHIELVEDAFNLYLDNISSSTNKP
jgi:hypothetical protein